MLDFGFDAQHKELKLGIREYVEDFKVRKGRYPRWKCKTDWGNMWFKYKDYSEKVAAKRKRIEAWTNEFKDEHEMVKRQLREYAESFLKRENRYPSNWHDWGNLWIEYKRLRNAIIMSIMALREKLTEHAECIKTRIGHYPTDNCRDWGVMWPEYKHYCTVVFWARIMVPEMKDTFLRICKSNSDIKEDMKRILTDTQLSYLAKIGAVHSVLERYPNEPHGMNGMNGMNMLLKAIDESP